MPSLFGNHFNKTELRKRIGDIGQIAGATPFCYTSGKAKETAAIEVRNGSGLRFIILPDRGMDIVYAEFQGIPFSYISKTGIVSPDHYDEPDFLRSFSAGLLTTCGLTYMGAPCVDEGHVLGEHGRISNTPAYDAGITQEWVNEEDYIITVRGKVRESIVFGENMVLTRTVTVKMGDNRIFIHDEVENEGFEPSPLMLLYHMNFGYPLVSPDTVLETNCVNLRARDEQVQSGINSSTIFGEPIHGFKEQVFYRDVAGDSYAALKNTKLNFGVKVEFSGEQLPYFIEWKQMGEQDYVVGLEPATWVPEGRAKARECGELIYLQPQAIKKQDLTVSVEQL
jgi:hypothetical protein